MNICLDSPDAKLLPYRAAEFLYYLLALPIKNQVSYIETSVKNVNYIGVVKLAFSISVWNYVNKKFDIFFSETRQQPCNFEQFSEMFRSSLDFKVVASLRKQSIYNSDELHGKTI